MYRVARAVLIVFALVAALAIAACGSNDEQNDYVDQVNEQTSQLQQAMTDATSNITPGDTESAGNAIDSAQQAIEENADALEAIDPPEEVADLHAQLVEATRSVADQLEEFQKALTGGNPQQLIQAVQKFQTDATQTLNQLRQTTDDINAELSD